MNDIIGCRAKCWTTVLIAVVLVGAIAPRMGTAADKAAIKQAVSLAAGYLRTNMADFRSDKRVLSAYALYKADDPVTSPEISTVLKEVVGKFPEGKYNPNIQNASIYEAGVTAMLLVEIDPEKYRPQLQQITDFLLNSRKENGSWDYRGGTGDTSVTQYGCLGFWAAARGGIDVPDEAWDKIMLWHFAAQLGDGGYPYTPGTKIGPGRGASTLNMTGAAIGSMTIAAMYLFPEETGKSLGFAGSKKKSQKPAETQKFGVLDRREPEPEVDDANEGDIMPVRPKPQGPYKIKSTFSAYKQHTGRALSWMNGHFEVVNSVGPAMYYYYTIERMAALTGVTEIGGQDWFEVCADELLKRQQADGSWTLSFHDGGGPYVIGTSFGILFLSRSTAKLLNRMPPTSAIGGGVLAGGRGLPDDLTQVELDRGAVAAREPAGPLDELLRDLSRAGAEDLFKLQEKIIEKIQLGDRSELIGQAGQLVKLVGHPDPQIRRTAMWALGRSDDLKLVRHAIAALIDDPDVGVLVEAHNALCWFSRRPDGFGLPDNPTNSLSPDASDEERQIAINKWRRVILKAWGEWYLRVCPYEERDDPFVISLKRRLNTRR